MSNKKINCRRCVYFFVTWQPNNPYGCKAYGFKSKMIPSMVVFQSSGRDCEMFRAKNISS
ncbi:MAG: uracil-DNA glycosylase [Campylobacterales bacterium]|nr:uracil-DNA glycosylase [Campylobacterales bacterium]